MMQGSNPNDRQNGVSLRERAKPRGEENTGGKCRPEFDALARCTGTVSGNLSLRGN